MKKLNENILISAVALWTLIAAVGQFGWLFSQSYLVESAETVAMIVSALGALGALVFSFTNQYRLIWIGFALAIFSPGEYGTFMPAVIGIILTLVKQNERKTPESATKPTTRGARAMPVISRIVGISLIVAPFLVGYTLSSIFCTNGWGPSCTFSVIPLYTILTAPIGIIFIVVGSLHRSRAVKPNAPIDRSEEHKGK